MPTTGADYRWMNLMARVPRKGLPLIAKRLGQGVGGLLLGRRYAAGGQALAAGLFAGVLRAGIPIWTDTALARLMTDGTKVTGAVVEHDGREVTVTARRGVVLAAGGFDHRMDMRWKFQSESLGEHMSLGAETNTGDAIRIAQEVGCRNRSHGPGMVVPRRRTAARRCAGGDAGRAVAARFADRRPGRQPVHQRGD